MDDNDKHLKEKCTSRRRILETSTELKKALEDWDELSRQEAKPSADEQMLADVKDLLKQLKHQLEDLE